MGNPWCELQVVGERAFGVGLSSCGGGGGGGWKNWLCGGDGGW
jgi:hypothetical protein